jgi:hypothetical protein
VQRLPVLVSSTRAWYPEPAWPGGSYSSMSPVSWLVWQRVGVVLFAWVLVVAGLVVALPGAEVGALGVTLTDVDGVGAPAGAAAPSWCRGLPPAHPVATARVRAAATASAVTRIGVVLPGHLIIGFDVEWCDAPRWDPVHEDFCQVDD